ncbi:MAG: hypothetical protein Q9157_007351 [Trypethelium eluteriae]
MQVNDVADALDRHIDFVADSLKDAAIRVNDAWGHLSGRPAPLPPPPPPPPRLPFFGPSTSLQHLQRWVSRHRAITAALVAFFGTSALLLYRQKRAYVKKRRAKKASNGARSEVVVVAGPAESPMVKGLAADLERRGFVVYVVVGSPQDELKVQENGRLDIRPLYMDITEPASAEDAMERFSRLLLNPHHAIVGATPHKLNLAGLVIAPDLDYPIGPAVTIEPAEWADAMNIKVLGTIYTAQAFLQVLTDFRARVIMLTPNVTSSMKSPFHSVESAVIGALEGFTYSLASELATLGIHVCHLKLGNFDLSSIGGRQHVQRIPGTAVRTWPTSAQATYGRNFISHSSDASRGSPPRELYNAVFDALVQKGPRQIWRVGRGSMAYEFVGNWVPAGLVQWMLGIRKMGNHTNNDRGAETASSEDEAHSGQWEKVEGTA